MAGKTFKKADAALSAKVARIIKTIHPRLCPPLEYDKPTGPFYAFRVETTLVFGPRNKEGIRTAAAITVRGCDAMACIRITKLEERVAGRGDAVMWIDGDHYKNWHAKTLDAIIDHELTHLEVVQRGDVPQFDDIGRLRLRMRPHDFEVGWFEEVAERHGEASAEAIQARSLTTKQMYFPEFDIIPRAGRVAG